MYGSIYAPEGQIEHATFFLTIQMAVLYVYGTQTLMKIGLKQYWKTSPALPAVAVSLRQDLRLEAVPDIKVHEANMGPPGSCRPQMGPMLAPWTLLSGVVAWRIYDPTEMAASTYDKPYLVKLVDLSEYLQVRFSLIARS